MKEKSREFDRSERKFKKERKQGKAKKKKRQFQNIVKQGRYDELDDYNEQ